MKNDNKNSAFSLIELMVVIAILGIVAAVGLQQYQSYKVKTLLARDYLRPMERLVEQARIFANTNDRFPTAAELGFTADMFGSGSQTVIGVDGGSPAPGTPIVTVPGTAYMQFVQQYGSGDPCKFAYFYTVFDAKGPINDSYIRSIMYYVVDTGSTFATYCFADEGDQLQTVGLDNNAISGCPSFSGALYDTMVTANSGDICGNF